MANKPDYISSLFEHHPDAIYILVEGRIVQENPRATAIRREYVFDLAKILDVCHNRRCPLHPIEEECHQCPVKEVPEADSFPFLLKTADGEQVNFTASYFSLDEEAAVLILRDLTHADKLQQLLQKKQLIDYVNNAHENERKRLAQELHDGLAQSIYSLMLAARRIKWLNEAAEKEQQIQLLDEGLNELLRDVKDMALDLRPSVLDDLGLIPSIHALVKRLSETTGVDAVLDLKVHQERFNPSVETAIYRILQESLINGVKYAEVDTIHVCLEQNEEHQLVLRVIDEGIGFHVNEQALLSGGLGLLNMRERAEAVGGTLDIVSSVGKGTMIIATVPLGGKRDESDDCR